MGTTHGLWLDMWLQRADEDGWQLVMWDVDLALDVPGLPAALSQPCLDRMPSHGTKDLLARLNLARAFGGVIVPTHSEPVRSLEPLRASGKFILAFDGPFAQVERRFMCAPKGSGMSVEIMAFLAADAADRTRPFDLRRSFTNAIEYALNDRVVLPFKAIRPPLSDLYAQNNYIVVHD